MARTLKQIADSIKINWIRVGFNPETECTKFIAIINQQQFEFSCGLFACIYDKTRPETLSSSAITYNPLDRLVKYWKNMPSSSYPYFKLYRALREGRAKALPNWGTWAQEIWEKISALCAPTNYDLLSALRSDCSSTSQSFPQWCEEFGYNNDSIKALGIYNACQENDKKLRVALGPALYKEVMECEEID